MEYDKAKLEWLEFDLLHPFTHVAHAVFLRHGGTSSGPCATLDLGKTTSDNPDQIKANRDVVRKTIGVPILIFPVQGHGTNVQRITAKNKDKGFQCDALFTTEKNIALGVTHADCQATLFYDPVHEAVAAVHAGWRGLAQNIYERVFDAMQREIGTRPQNLIVCIAQSNLFLREQHLKKFGNKVLSSVAEET